MLFESVPHYTEISSELITNPSFEEGLLGWDSSKYVNKDQLQTINLSNSNPNEIQSIWQLIPTPESRALRVTALYSIRNVKQGPENWQNARLGVAGRDQAGKWRWDFRGTVFSQTGTANLVHASRVVVIPDDVDKLKVEFELSGTTGEFRVHEIKTAAVELLAAIKVLRFSLEIAWAFLGALIFLLFLYYRLWFPVFGGTALVFLLLFIPKSQKDELLYWTSGWLPSLWQIDFDHLLLFLLLSSSVLIYIKLSGRAHSIFWIMSSFVCTAISMEVLQYFILFRTVSFGDGAINIAGVLLPVGVYILAEHLSEKLKEWKD
ncbi:MAG: hypothetical protein ACJAVI_002454 [Candidatus Azotimanducaceae bacterium]